MARAIKFRLTPNEKTDKSSVVTSEKFDQIVDKMLVDGLLQEIDGRLSMTSRGNTAYKHMKARDAAHDNEDVDLLLFHLNLNKTN